MNHEEFIKKLKDLGFDIQVFAFQGTESHLFVNGLLITTTNYRPFGYYCGGQYAPCSRTDKNEFTQEDLELAIKTATDSIMGSYSQLFKEPNIHDIKDYLGNYGTTKIEKSSIERVLAIIKDNYQEIYKGTKEFSTTPKKYWEQ